jgi:glutamyl-tRNA synthetase
VEQGSFFFIAPQKIDTASILQKWNENKNRFFVELIRSFSLLQSWEPGEVEHTFKELAAAAKLKPGELMGAFRLMLVGGKFGPGVFEISSVLGQQETTNRITHALSSLQ